MRKILVMIKPDVYDKEREWLKNVELEKVIRGKVIDLFWNPIYDKVLELNDEDIKAIYREHVWKDFYWRLNDSMKWRVTAMIFEIEENELSFADLIDIKSNIRDTYSLWLARNTIHISSSIEDAEFETGYFLKK